MKQYTSCAPYASLNMSFIKARTKMTLTPLQVYFCIGVLFSSFIVVIAPSFSPRLLHVRSKLINYSRHLFQYSAFHMPQITYVFFCVNATYATSLLCHFPLQSLHGIPLCNIIALRYYERKPHRLLSLNCPSMRFYICACMQRLRYFGHHFAFNLHLGSLRCYISKGTADFFHLHIVCLSIITYGIYAFSRPWSFNFHILFHRQWRKSNQCQIFFEKLQLRCRRKIHYHIIHRVSNQLRFLLLKVNPIYSKTLWNLFYECTCVFLPFCPAPKRSHS